MRCHAREWSCWGSHHAVAHREEVDLKDDLPLLLLLYVLLSAHYVWDNSLSLFYRESYSIFVKIQWVESHFTSEGTCLSSFRMLWQNIRNWVSCKLGNDEHLYLTILEVWSLRSGCQHGWMRSLFSVANFFCPHMAGGGIFRDSVKSWKPLEKGLVWLDLGFRIIRNYNLILIEIINSNKK